MVRRKFSAQFKEQVVRECHEIGNVSLVARKHGIVDSVIRRWVNQSQQVDGLRKSPGSPTHVTLSEHQEVVSERNELAREVEQMKKVLGEQALEIAILRDLTKKAPPHMRKR